MKTLKIYKVQCYKGFMASEVGEGYSLRPWGRNTMYYEGEDDGGKNYLLPEGYTLGECNDGNTNIFDQAGHICFLGTKNNHPAVINTDGDIIPLQKIEQNV